jgi:hypothetical protein
VEGDGASPPASPAASTAAPSSPPPAGSPADPQREDESAAVAERGERAASGFEMRGEEHADPLAAVTEEVVSPHERRRAASGQEATSSSGGGVVEGAAAGAGATGAAAEGVVAVDELRTDADLRDGVDAAPGGGGGAAPEGDSLGDDERAGDGGAGSRSEVVPGSPPAAAWEVRYTTLARATRDETPCVSYRDLMRVYSATWEMHHRRWSAVTRRSCQHSSPWREHSPQRERPACSEGSRWKTCSL